MTATSGGRINKSSCLKCKNIVKSGENALRRDGFCENWYHMTCTNMGEDEYGKINDLKQFVLWMCVNCKKH